MTSSLPRTLENAARRPRRARPLGLVAVLAVLCHASGAEPYEPRSDDVVLASVATGSQSRTVRTLRAALAANPADLDTALRLARIWLDAGRREGDPRFFSYAQATLSPWTQRADAPVDTLILAATSLQSLHRFDQAQQLLDRALESDPHDPQAWLTMSTLLQLRGEFAAARRACTHLIGAVDHRVALGCIASAQSKNGHLVESYRALRQVMTDDRPLASAERAWLLGMLGEMAVRIGEPAAAQRHFNAALLADPGDTYIRAELADLHLRASRHDAVVALLQDYESQDALLLRLAIAGKHLGTHAGSRWRAMYETRYQTAIRDRDDTHLREHARYLLEVRGDAAGALRAAERNWRVQREPADVRVYRLAALAAGGSLDAIDTWIAANRYQDATLDLPSAPQQRVTP